MSTTPIEYVYTQNVECVSMRIETNNLTLFQSCVFSVSLLDANNNVVKVHILDMTGDDYTNWGGDDSYVVNWVKAKLNIQ